MFLTFGGVGRTAALDVYGTVLKQRDAIGCRISWRLQHLGTRYGGPHIALIVPGDTMQVRQQSPHKAILPAPGLGHGNAMIQNRKVHSALVAR